MAEYKNYGEFFEECGDQYLHPKSFGENFYRVTVEEMYQHFKERLTVEVAVYSQELLYSGELFDTTIFKRPSRKG